MSWAMFDYTFSHNLPDDGPEVMPEIKLWRGVVVRFVQDLFGAAQNPSSKTRNYRVIAREDWIKNREHILTVFEKAELGEDNVRTLVAWVDRICEDHEFQKRHGGQDGSPPLLVEGKKTLNMKRTTHSQAMRRRGGDRGKQKCKI